MSAVEKHTPGPYAVFADERGIIISANEGRTRLARMLSADGHDLDNAHLFATAPELVTALREQIAECFDPLCDMCSRHEELIRKATGGQS